jgi:TfoX/Sxy family transcriptional regulator of competence genes
MKQGKTCHVTQFHQNGAVTLLAHLLRILEKTTIQISAQGPATLYEVSRGFTQSLKTNAC